jgi:hypothetical protein
VFSELLGNIVSRSNYILHLHNSGRMAGLLAALSGVIVSYSSAGALCTRVGSRSSWLTEPYVAKLKFRQSCPQPCIHASAPVASRRCSPFQFRDPRLNVLDLDCLRCVIED